MAVQQDLVTTEESISRSVDKATPSGDGANEMLHLSELSRLSARIRSVVLRMIHAAESGHIGSSLSCADIITVLRFDQMNWMETTADRDIFVLSKGHAAPAWYAALIIAGDLDLALMYGLRTLDSPLQGHPDRMRCQFVDVSTGALGQGLSIALGRAEARQLRNAPGYAFCVLGDGECQEGQIWEAAMYAGARRLPNIIAIVDHNGMQSDGPVEDSVTLGSIADKFWSFGWHVQEVDGHSHRALKTAIAAAKDHTTAPSVIIARTIKGHLSHGRQVLKGAHGGALSTEEFNDAICYL